MPSPHQSVSQEQEEFERLNALGKNYQAKPFWTPNLNKKMAA